MTHPGETAPTGVLETLDPEAFQAFTARAQEGPVIMLNLLKFKPRGGEEMYARYAEAVLPFLQKCGARVIYMGRTAERLLGRDAWDSLILVEYPTRQAFIGMISSPDYQAIQHLRDESLERSVLYATDPAPIPAPR